MALKRFYEEFCPDCGKKQTGRTESNNRIWWIWCDCLKIPGPTDYPRLVNKKNIISERDKKNRENSQQFADMREILEKYGVVKMKGLDNGKR